MVCKNGSRFQFHGLRLTVVPARTQRRGGGTGDRVPRRRRPGTRWRQDRSISPATRRSTAIWFRHHRPRWRLDAVLLPIGDLRMLGLPFRHMGPGLGSGTSGAGRAADCRSDHYSGMTLGPLMAFRGTPRKLSQAIYQAELGTVVGRHGRWSRWKSDSWMLGGRWRPSLRSKGSGHLRLAICSQC